MGWGSFRWSNGGPEEALHLARGLLRKGGRFAENFHQSPWVITKAADLTPSLIISEMESILGESHVVRALRHRSAVRQDRKGRAQHPHVDSA